MRQPHPLVGLHDPASDLMEVWEIFQVNWPMALCRKTSRWRADGGGGRREGSFVVFAVFFSSHFSTSFRGLTLGRQMEYKDDEGGGVCRWSSSSSSSSLSSLLLLLFSSSDATAAAAGKEEEGPSSHLV